MQKAETSSYYQKKLEDILIYIQKNLNHDLNLKTLADYSNISQFHFHRIISAYLGESLGSYINRLRLDTAARAIKTSNESISEIARDIGYSDLQAFSKSFTRAYGISPSEYRDDRESLIDSTNDFILVKDEIKMNNPGIRVKNIKKRFVAYIETKGRYGGAECYAAWDELTGFVKTNSLFTWNSEAFSIYYDDPDVVGAENCRFDICISVKKPAPTTGNIKFKETEGGKYLVYRYKGPYENLWEVYYMLYREVISGLKNYKLRDLPVVEKYIKYSEKTKPANLVTEMYIPIE